MPLGEMAYALIKVKSIRQDLYTAIEVSNWRYIRITCGEKTIYIEVNFHPVSCIRQLRAGYLANGDFHRIRLIKQNDTSRG